MFFVFVLFMINVVRDGFFVVDEKFEVVVRMFGVFCWWVFLFILFLMVFLFIVSGVIMMWVRVISEVGVILIVVYYFKIV